MPVSVSLNVTKACDAAVFVFLVHFTLLNNIKTRKNGFGSKSGSGRKTYYCQPVHTALTSQKLNADIHASNS